MVRLPARILVALAFVAAVVAPPQTARASDEPGVARVRVLRGDVELTRIDSGDTVAAAINAPVAVGDSLTTHAGSRAEVEFDYGTALRIAPQSQVRFTKLDARDHVVQLAAGSVEVRVFRSRGAYARIESPQATLRPRGIGRFRMTIESGSRTDTTARTGSADIITDAGTQTLASGSTLAISGTFARPAVREIAAAAPDDFDRWSDSRDEAIARSHETAYLDADLVGASDLDAYGRWLDDPRYGQVWSPYVNAGWAPYHDGRFTWQPYYGWTWIAAEPWGWAPYHYGNWFYAHGPGWCWAPGVHAAFAQPYIYRPAVVAFFSFGGSSGFNAGFGNIGWVPLAPFEPFYPWYGGYGNVTAINNTTNVTNVTYVTPPAPSGQTYTIYHNVRAPGGFVKLGRADFSNGRFDRVATVSPAQLGHATVVRGVLPVVPTANSLAPSVHMPPQAVTPVSPAFAHLAPPQTSTRTFAVEREHARNAAHALPTVIIGAPSAASTRTLSPSDRFDDPASASETSATRVDAARASAGMPAEPGATPRMRFDRTRAFDAPAAPVGSARMRPTGSANPVVVPAMPSQAVPSQAVPSQAVSAHTGLPQAGAPHSRTPQSSVLHEVDGRVTHPTRFERTSVRTN